MKVLKVFIFLIMASLLQAGHSYAAPKNNPAKYISSEEAAKILQKMGIAQNNDLQYVKSADTDTKGWRVHLFRINQNSVQMPLVTYVSNDEVVVGILIKNGRLVVPKMPVDELQPVLDMSKFKLSADKRLAYNPGGKETIYMFTDPDCPYCQSTEESLRKYNGKYKVVIKHFPLEQIHPGAKEKAIAKQCLSMSRNCDERMRQLAAGIVDEDIQEGTTIGVDGTPFFITKSGSVMRQIPDLKQN